MIITMVVAFYIQDNLMHERAQENDESYFLWAMKFFMEFTRHYNFRVDYVGYVK